MPQRGILWVELSLKTVLHSGGMFCAESRIAQRVPLERFSKFDCIFYPQNVPPEQKALN